MDKVFENDRVRSLKEIMARHENREIEGCTSWRHFAVHQDRAWLLNALGKIHGQVEKIHQAKSMDKTKYDAGVQELFRLFEEETLNHLGDESP